MALTPGLNANIRQPMPEPEALQPGVEVIVEDADEGSDLPEYGDRGEILRIEHPDGSISVSLDGTPIAGGPQKPNLDWFDNLVDEVSDTELSRIAETFRASDGREKLSVCVCRVNYSVAVHAANGHGDGAGGCHWPAFLAVTRTV